MRAVVLSEYGDVGVLHLADVVDPVPGPEEVLVEVAATALNRADLLQRLGLYPSPPLAGFAPPAPEIPGMEFSGRVVACGDRVSRWSVGDAVMGIVGGGAYAERLVVHADQILPVPSPVSIVDAAAIPEVWITAFDALVVQGGLTSGRTALVHAGASGVGTAAIGICRAVGARSIVTTSTGKVDACRSLGADVVVDYTVEDFVERSLEATEGAGVDVVLDVVGGAYVDRNVRSIRVGGRIIQVGTMGGGRSEIALGALLPKRASIIGTVLRSRPLDEKIAITRRFAAEIAPLFERGLLAPVIDSRYPLDEIASAHSRMESNANVGKIVIEIGR